MNEGCSYCEGDEELLSSTSMIEETRMFVEIDKGDGTITISGNDVLRRHFEERVEISYCPMCGRGL